MKSILLVVRNELAFKWVLYFLAFVVVDALFSFYVFEYNILGIIKVFRNYLFLLSLGVFLLVPVRDLKKALHTLALVTVFQSFLYLLQIPLGIPLLQAGLAGSEVIIHSAQETGLARFYNTPLFLTLTLFYFLLYYKYRSRLVNIFIVVILILAVLAPMHRGYIFSLTVIISVYLIFKESKKYKVFKVAALAICIVGVSFSGILDSRLSKGFSDFNKTFSGNRSITTISFDDNTFAYRIAHLVERYNFINNDPKRYVFGIGFLSEEAKQAEKLPFSVGVIDEKSGRVNQINTGDIAWSLLVLQLGLAGTFLFVVILIAAIIFLYGKRIVPFSTIAMLILINSIFISFTGTEILMIPVRVAFLLLISLTIKSYHEYRVAHSNKRTSRQYARGIYGSPLESPSVLVVST
ncbi:hypothetical protein JYG30_21730 [Fibrella sp. USSR17]